MITLNSLQDVVNDLRVDQTSGTVDINSEGLRAVNYILDDLQARHDWESCERDLSFRCYPRILSYALPSDLKSLRALYAQNGFFNDFDMREVTVFKRLTRWNGHPVPLVAFERGFNKRLHVWFPWNQGYWISIMNNKAYNSNGTWIDGGTGKVTNIRSDNMVYFTLGGSTAFDILPGSQSTGASILKTASSPFDLTQYQDGVITQEIDFSTDWSRISGVSLRVGTDALNYYDCGTGTTQADGTAFEAGRNLLKFDYENATVVGSPTRSNTLYYYMAFTYNADNTSTVKGYHLGDMLAQTYQNITLRYYSLNAVRDASTGQLVQHFDGTDSSDSLVLSDEMGGLISTGSAWMLADQQGDQTLSEKSKAKYEQLLAGFKAKYPSKTMMPEPPVLSLEPHFPYGTAY